MNLAHEASWTSLARRYARAPSLEGFDCDHVVVAHQARARLMKVVCATDGPLLRGIAALAIRALLRPLEPRVFRASARCAIRRRRSALRAALRLGITPPSESAAKVVMPRSTPTARRPRRKAAASAASTAKPTVHPFTSRRKTQLLMTASAGIGRCRCTRSAPGMPLNRSLPARIEIPQNSRKPKLSNRPLPRNRGKPGLPPFFTRLKEAFVRLIQAFQRRALQGYGQSRGLRVVLPPLGERLASGRNTCESLAPCDTRRSAPPAPRCRAGAGTRGSPRALGAAAS